MDLMLDPATGDLALDLAGDLRTVDGAEAIRQHVEVRLTLVRGEWFLNEREGIPYFEEILVKGVDLDRVKRIFTEAIIGTPGVVEVPSFQITDLGARRWSIDFQARADTGEVLTFTDFVVGG